MSLESNTKLETSRYILLYRVGHEPLLNSKELKGYNYNILQDPDNPDQFYLVMSDRHDQNYAKIENFTDSHVGVYEIVKYDPRIRSFTLRRILALTGYHALGRFGIPVRRKIVIEEYNNHGFPFVFLNSAGRKKRKTIYVERVVKRDDRDIVLYKRFNKRSIAFVRISKSAFFNKIEKPKRWDSWLYLCTSEEECRFILRW